MSNMTAAGLPLAEQDAEDRRDRRARIEVEQLADLTTDLPPLDPQLGRGEGNAAALGQRRIRLEPLEPLVELARHGDAADERAAALPADDLARVLEALEGGAQGAP